MTIFSFKENQSFSKIVFILLAFVLILKFCISNYGLPNEYHCDEIYIYKDSFRIPFEILNGNFSNSTNLYYWILLIWYLIFFVVLLITGQVSNLTQFKELLITESPEILQHGRYLSIILSLIGIYYFFKLISNYTNKKWIFLLICILFAFNPIEYVSNLWIKFDAIVFCFLGIFLYFLHKHFILKKHSIRFIYILAFVGLSIRVDLVFLILLVIILDFKHSDFNLSFLKKRFLIFLLGILVFSIITLYPIQFFSSNEVLNSSNSNENFESVISKNYSSYSLTQIKNHLVSNSFFYFIKILLVTICPLILIFILLNFRKLSFLSKAYFTISLIYLVPILLYHAHATHYFLLPSVFILLVFAETTQMELYQNSRVLIISSIYSFSLVLSIVFTINFKTDTRELGKNYISATTSSNDTIAIENYVNIGAYPPIYETSLQQIEKSKACKEIHLGSGESFELKSQNKKLFRRPIIEISEIPSFQHTKFAEKWGFTRIEFAENKQLPKLILTKDKIKNSKITFEKYVFINYNLDKSYVAKYWDFRLSFLFESENFNPPIYIYKIKK